MTRIAFPTDDGVTISAHFGRAHYVMVATLGDDDTPHFEKREKTAHHHAASHAEAGHEITLHDAEVDHDGDAHHEGEHGQHDHRGMFTALADCQALIAGGMGQPAYEHAVGMGLQVILTGEKVITTALEAFRNNTLQNDPRRIHHRH